MTRYEKILSKIAPTFFKLIQYHDYATKQENFITSYLIYVNIPTQYDLAYLPLSSTYYYSSYHFTSIRYGLGIDYGNVERIILKKKEEGIGSDDLATVDELIVNPIINRFSYENEYIDAELGLSYKKYVIAMIGKDMYETIRSNIK